MIEIKNLFKSFGSLEVLKNVNTTINKGEKVVIVGPSGSGKSTLLRCLNLLETPTKGEIWFEGNNITDKKCDINKVRQKMGMVFQHFNLFPHLTIIENITLAPIKLGLQTKDEANENAIRLLKRIGLEDKKDSYPASLSGGQKQRLVIARSLTVNPKIILLDEPCSSLDMKNTNNIEKMLINLKCEYTIIIVTHNLAQAKRIADKVIFVDCGNIVEVGTTDEIFSNPKDKRTKEYITYMGN